jgi:ABC-type sugar transport system ATPase subunit
MIDADSRLSVRNFSVSFGGNRALDSLDLDVFPGSVVALLGANGSGKSTAVKALTGINPIDGGGSIRLNGSQLDVNALTPGVARSRGIRVVHQEAPLVPDLTVEETIALHVGFPTKSGLIRQRKLHRQSARLLAEFGIDIDLKRLCKTLSPSERSLVSLAVALGDIRVDEAVLILDEATASLSTTEAERFLLKVGELSDRGLAVLMVTHRLPEVRAHCDRTVVLRDGAVVESFTRSTFDEGEVVKAMVGPNVGRLAGELRSAASGPAQAPGLKENRLVGRELRGPGIDGISFEAEQGEILGITGRAGGGASGLLRLVGGIEARESGTLTLGDVSVGARSAREAIGAGIFYLSADRLTEGGVPAMTVGENLVLPKVERYGWGQSKARKDISSMMALLDVRPSDPFATFGGLSGGNQQKVLLARWLLLGPRVLLLDDPTAGVDPHTREVIFANLRELAARGTTVLLRSTEPEQLARLCKRVLVIRDGLVVRELNDDRVTIEEISLATYA